MRISDERKKIEKEEMSAIMKQITKYRLLQKKIMEGRREEKKEGNVGVTEEKYRSQEMKKEREIIGVEIGRQDGKCREEKMKTRKEGKMKERNLESNKESRGRERITKKKGKKVRRRNEMKDKRKDNCNKKERKERKRK